MVFCLAAAFANAQTNLTALLQQGLFDEQAARNLPAAIADYQALATQFDKDRQTVATAIFRLGECYRMEDKTNEAAQEYQRIIRDFSDQTTLASLSRQNLIGMGMGTGNSVNTGIVPVPVLAENPRSVPSASTPTAPSADTEDQEIKNIQAMIQNSPDLINGKPLCDAAYAGQLRVATFLLDHGANVNAGDGRETPLIRAARNAQMTMAELLLSRGADVNARDGGTTQTALIAATAEGYESVVKVLLEHKADVNEPYGHINYGNTPLDVAVQNGYANLVGLFLTNGADINATNDGGRTALNEAVRLGQAHIVQMFLDAGANPNIPDNYGIAPLSATRAPEIIQALLAAKADPNGGTLNAPLLAAVHRNDIADATLLLQAGANPNLEGKVGADYRSSGNSDASPLWTAVAMGEFPMVQLLLKYKADPNDTQIEGQSILFDALDKTNILETLLDAGATVDASSYIVNQRATPLETAAQYGEIAAAEILLNHGANPNYRDLNGDTPLHYAQSTPSREMVGLLLDHHADPNVRNSQGKTPLDWLKEQARGNNGSQKRAETAAQLVNYLRSRGALDVLPDWDHITVSRPSTKYSSGVFYKGTNDWNQITLFDLIGVQYELLTASISLSNIRFPPMPYGDGIIIAGQNSLSFPDFARISIHRPSATGTNWTDLKINLAHALESGDCSADVPLQFGDVVEIPETDHVINQLWYGLNTNELFSLKKCLIRHLQVTINGQATNVVIAPQVELDAPPFAFMQPSIKVSKFQPFMIWPVLENSQLLLASSDLSRVEVKRRDTTTGKMHQWTVDCSNSDSPPNFWLRDGDEIIVPEKPN
ncbi:MAG TPA: ankyrin repeat domain-containing protein [Verrucomicrobiae bacterium]